MPLFVRLVVFLGYNDLVSEWLIAVFNVFGKIK